MTTLRRFLTCENGATAIEYGLIATLVSAGIMVGAGYFADSLQSLWSDGSSQIIEVLNAH